MKLNSYISTITFEVDMKTEPGFMVDIVETPTTYEAWLYHKDYGVKDLMFGADKAQHKDKAEFCDIVEANLYNQDYINGYKDEYMIN